MEMINTTPIDFVIPWVDGNDLEWKACKEAYSMDGEQAKSVHLFDYKDWGLLRYWFRGVEQYCPWVNKVYFVTWGHLPNWLNENCDKLVIVRHEDFIPKKYLPTFSSHVIELNLHRIKNLSEQFVYFNDDMYIVRKTSPTYFFSDGLPCDSAIVNPIAPRAKDTIAHLMLTNIAVINENFDKYASMRRYWKKWFTLKYRYLLPLNFLFLPWRRFPGLLEKHVPTSFLKKSYDEIWEKEIEILERTCSHRFRNFKTDVNQWVIKEWQIAKGNFTPREITSSKFYTIYNEKDANNVAHDLKNHKYNMVCINDHIINEESNAMDVIVDAFEDLFPEKSSFER